MKLIIQKAVTKMNTLKDFKTFHLLFLMTTPINKGLYIFFGLFGKLVSLSSFSIINLESSFLLNLSVLFVHLIILNVALYLMLKLIKIDYFKV